MSVEVLIIPVIWDAIVATSILMENHEQATLMVRMEKGLLTEEEAQAMNLEVEAYKRSGIDVRTGNTIDTKGGSILIHTNEGYDVGLKKNLRGAYDVVIHWDQSPDKIYVKQVREDIEAKIKQKYAYEKVRRELAKNGFMISQEETQPDESIRLVARKW